MGHISESPGELEAFASVLKELGQKSGSTEALAADALNYLYNQLNRGLDSPCALMRFFRTVPFSELTVNLQELARQSLHREPSGLVNCLTLLASRGMLPEWNDRFASKQHQVIPLISTQMIEEAPMIAQLIERLGITVSQVVEPSPTIFLDPGEKKYNILYVPEAKGSATIVAQDDFVDKHKIRTVIGIGGLLPTGDMFAVMMFMRVFIPAETAQRFVLLARALEGAIAEVRSGKKAKARILVAAADHDAERLLRLLGDEHSIVKASSIDAAIAAASSEIFDLIMCGVDFDESRMFELLRAVKQNGRLKPKPFICFRQGQTNLGRASETGLLAAARVAGATCYLNAFNMEDGELLSAVEAYLPEEIWMDGGRLN
jgi:CheY-like chemotaxis protein